MRCSTNCVFMETWEPGNEASVKHVTRKTRIVLYPDSVLQTPEMKNDELHFSCPRQLGHASKDE